MSEKKQETIREFVARRERNLAFFKRHFPKLYKRFNGIEFKRVEVQVGAEDGTVDLKVDGTSWYQGNAKEYGRVEANTFLEQVGTDKLVYLERPPFYKRSEESGLMLRYLYQATQGSSCKPGEYKGSVLGKLLPSIVFVGVGLGHHIERVLQEREALEIVIFESDPEIFAASLFTVDWEFVFNCVKRAGNGGVRFVISEGDSDQWLSARNLQEVLYQLEPIFPAATLYYKHQAAQQAREISERINTGISSRMLNWGNFDDELRRINNVLYNTRSKMEILKKEKIQTGKQGVAVIGSGPSIDDRIEDLKKVRDKVLVVSAGTSLKVLYRNGITPDYHVELDPKFIVYEHLKEIDHDYLANVTLLAALEVNPYVPDLFKRCIFYAKSGTFHHGLLDTDVDCFKHCNPTCTNAAAAIFGQLGLRNIFLFGCDYGFWEVQRDHSNASVYGSQDESSVSQALKQKTRSKDSGKKIFQVEAVNGGMIYTRANYYDAKQQMELQARTMQTTHRKLQFWNCSDGAVIESVPWLDADQMMRFFERRDGGGRKTNSTHMPKQAIFMDEQTVRALIERLTNEVANCCEELRYIASRWTVSTSRDVLQLARAVVRHYAKKHSVARISVVERIAGTLIQGVIKRLGVTGISHALAHTDDSELQVFMNAWQAALVDCLEEIPAYVRDALEPGRARSENPLVLMGGTDEGVNNVLHLSGVAD